MNLCVSDTSLVCRYISGLLGFARPAARRRGIQTVIPGQRLGGAVGVPEERFQVEGCDVLAIGTIAGYEADGPRVQAAFEAHDPEVVGLGIPPEDLDGLAQLADVDDALELLPELSVSEERLFELLKRWGPSRVPSPDLEVAYQLATAAGTPLEALDMDDHTHSSVYIKQVGFRTVIRSGRLQKKVLLQEFADAEDAYDLVQRWDAFQNNLKQLRKVEEMREEHMATRIREEAASRTKMLVVLPVARFEGVVGRLAQPQG